MKAFAVNCTLKASPEPSSTDLLVDQIGEELRAHKVTMQRARIADHQIARGVSADEGDGPRQPTRW